MDSSTILIVEDEPDLVRILKYNLEREGFRTFAAGTGNEALAILDREPHVDLVLLDLMLPDMSGIEVCRRIRAAERTKGLSVLMLTAKGEEIDRVVGFEVGADDYLVKPFSVRELMLRVRAILRRARPPEPEAEMVTFGSLRIDQAGYRVWVGDEEAILTALEFRLLATLLARKGRVQTRDALLADVWSIEADITTRTVDTHVKRLREKLGPAGEYVETVRGVGYRFRLRPDGEDA
ncbi:MAG: response regulator transcription factor [Deltaproteobacteria bacterium]|nr:response regulator transcription factor [Deltaproteobacteria bacterium]